MPYRHTQRGTLIMFLCLVLVALDAAIAWRSGQWLPAVALIILIAIAFVFSSLTVEVNGGELRWHFGPGFWSYRIALDNIETVAVVRNHWWNGFGIRNAARLRVQRAFPTPSVGGSFMHNSGAIRAAGWWKCVCVPRMLRSTPLLGVVRC
jgi:hypothetical protein